jgi:chromosome segregation ATPase
VVVISPQVVVQTGKPITTFEGTALALHEKLHEALSSKDAAIREGLTAKLEAAELRCTDARASVKELESKLAAARKELDEAQEALTFLDSLTEAPFSVIRAVLG